MRTLGGRAEEVHSEEAHSMGGVPAQRFASRPDEKAAFKAAVREFEITPQQQNRLLIRRA
jgi:hypothetical protein